LHQPAPPPPAPKAALDAIERFRQLLSNGSWFAAVGAQLTPAELGEAASYLAAIGLGRWSVAAVADWTQAKSLAKRRFSDSDWCGAEQSLRAQLLDEASLRLGETRLVQDLKKISESASDAVLSAAGVVAARSGPVDGALLRGAAEAASESASDAALAIATGGGVDHPFLTKHRLFAAGRWPMGVIDGEFRLF
jgi:hypothetical protein